MKNSMKRSIAFLCTALICTAPASLIPDMSENNNFFNITNAAADSIDSYADEVIVLVNKQREAVGAAPLKTSPLLKKLAAIRSQELTETFSHTRPDGSSGMYILEEYSDYNVQFMYSGENIACGYRNPDDVMAGWLDSEGHRKNILSTNYNAIGVGVVYSPGSQYGYYWVQIFYNIPDTMEGEYIPSETETTTTTVTEPDITTTSEIITSTEPDITTTSEIVTSTEPDITTTSEIVTSTEPDITTTSEIVTSTEPDITTTSEIVTSTEPDITTTSEPMHSCIIGDVNCDYTIDVCDVTALKQYIIKLISLDKDSLNNCNIVKDNVVDVKDLGQLIKYIIKMVNEL